MFALPDEILELIVQKNDDSIRTLISWSLLSPHVRDLVSKEIGIITIQDGLMTPYENLLGYQCLISNGEIPNHLNINSNDIEEEDMMTNEPSFIHFISHFDNILIVIESTRSHSEKLANTLTRIANSCHKGINICVFYKTQTNFLSNVYFKPFTQILPIISLTELYLFGNNESFQSENNLVDISTLFNTVHIEQMKSIYSLDIIDDTKEFNGPELTSIKKIIYNESANVDHFLRHCKNIKNIDYLKFPIMKDCIGKYTFNLPRCERITLNEFNNNVSYPIINGVKVTQKLTLKPTLRSTDPDFQNLYFPNIKTLSLPIYEFKVVNFRNCDFDSVRNLNVESCIIPWRNLYLFKTREEKEIKLNVTLRFTDWQQLQWLKSCPYKIENLEITGNELQFLPTIFISDPSFFDSSFDHTINFKDLNNPNKIETFTLHIDSLEQCNFVQDLVSAKDLNTPSSSFEIIMHESKLRDSILMNKNYKLTQEIVIPISTMKHLTILLLDQNIPEQQFFQRGRLLSDETVGASKKESTPFGNEKLSSIKFKNNLKPQVNTISPSQFRKNSLAGLPSHEARKQSVISFNSLGPIDLTPERRRSSLDSVSLFSNLHYLYTDEYAIDDSSEQKKLVTLELQGTKCPEIITLNLNSIESSVIQFSDIQKKMRVLLLQIWFTPDPPFTTYKALILNLTNKIIDMMHYPYGQMLNLHSFQKLQLFVDLTGIREKFEVSITFKTLTNDLSYNLSRKGHSMNFIKYTKNDRELVERSANFSICINI